MGTRALTVFISEYTGNDVAVLYRQSDGYLECHGKQLAEFLRGIKMVNGISDYSAKIANGVGCLAAQTVAYFKDNVGLFYLKESGTRDVGEDFIYEVSGKEGEYPNIKVLSYSEILFDGTADELLQKIESGFFDSED